MKRNLVEKLAIKLDVYPDALRIEHRRPTLVKVRMLKMGDKRVSKKNKEKVSI